MISVNETDIKLNQESGSCWVDNGTVAVYLIFNGDSVLVSAAPVNDEMTELPATRFGDTKVAFALTVEQEHENP